MPIFHEPIMHDRQSTDVTGPIVLASSASFTVIPGSQITTKDLGVDGIYYATAVLDIQHSNNNSLVETRACINGVPQFTRGFFFGPNSSGDPKTIPAVALSGPIPKGSIIDVEWRTDTDSATLNSMTIIIDGIPEHRVVK